MGDFLTRIYDLTLSFLFPQSETVQKLETLAKENNLVLLPKAKDEMHAGASSLFSYKDRFVRELVWQIKYRNNKILKNAVAKLMYEMILEDIGNSKLFDSTLPILIPIPMTSKRRNERGFNQSEEIAEAIVEQSKEKWIEYRNDILKKEKETLSQSKTKNRKERLENIKGSFSLTAPHIHGRNIILIDDVITTGSTIAEAVRVLRNAGVKSISTYTIAH